MHGEKSLSSAVAVERAERAGTFTLGAYASALAVTLITALGLYLRVGPALASPFPLNDGGLFYLMAQELRDASYALPWFTSYNGLDIPFAYPPLALYFVALLSDLTGWSLLDIARVFPAIASALALPPFYLLSKAILNSQRQALIATFAFAMLPRTFLWEVMGGGVTRAPAFLFALLMLHQAYLLYTRREWKFVLATTLFAALLALTHTEKTFFAAYSVAFIFVLFGLNRKSILHTAVVAVGVLALASPWWATVVSRHGPGPLLSALGSGNYNTAAFYGFFAFNFTEEPFVPLLAVAGLLGLFVCFAERKLFLPIWLLLPFVLTPNGAPTYGAVPLAMLIGISVDRIILPRILSLDAFRRAPSPSGPKPLLSKIAFAVVLYLATLPVLSAWIAAFDKLPTRYLSGDERQAMQWVASNTPADSRFIIFAAQSSPDDRTYEWFPALTGRASLMTAQGTEWLPDREFYRRQVRLATLLPCASRESTCLDSGAQRLGTSYTHVYIRKEQSAAYKTYAPVLESSLLTSPDYSLLYDGPGALIFARTGGAAR